MIPRLFALLAFVVALSAGHASAQVWTFEPVSSTVWIKGRTENVTWRNELEKGQGIETIDIELGTGSSNRVGVGHMEAWTSCFLPDPPSSFIFIMQLTRFR